MARKETESELCSTVVGTNVRFKQVTPLVEVETWLMSYNEWKARLEYLQVELSHIPELTRTLHLIATRNYTQKQETVLRTVMRRMEITEYEIPLLLSKIGLIDYAFTALTPEESLFVRLRYLEKLTSTEVGNRLVLSRRTFFYHRKRILNKIYLKIKDRTFLLELDSLEEA
ncbi:hypothetical protein SK3146_05744 [Paenibacillus konkukensis]|uniref:HTH luxR-type domain-containing protein n=1 Tax=Paenibacillus konkukensis TaxID=2020716 RepID=A0ABY4RVI1_9BACL|nr:hypothetical protein [Paenibacillus konkukensis]UQZ86451.1 hypothetical protein SK3146_05744 [Paenibacillus konkukensis]